MTDLSAFIYKDGNTFYFDPENYTGDFNKNLTLEFEDGDTIRWIWESCVMTGTLREEGSGAKLFVLKNVTKR